MLIDPVDTHSFIASGFALGAGRVMDRLPEVLVVSTPMADTYAVEHVYKQCEARICGHIFLVDLMPA